MVSPLRRIHCPTSVNTRTESSGTLPSPRGPMFQVIAGVPRASNQILNHASGALPIIIGPLVYPTVIEGHAGFPGPALGIRLNLLLGSRKIARKFVAVVDDDVRLELEHHLVHALGFPAGSVERPRDVIPKHINLSVVAQQLANVRVDVFDEAFPCRLIGRAACAVWMMPVH